MPKKSAGILPFRETSQGPEVLLVHPGGPFWTKKDLGSWSIAKGEFEDEDPLAAAKREFEEETGFQAVGDLLPLDPLRQPGGKVVYAWAMQADLDPSGVKSNVFTLEWPPRSGRQRQFPEVDRAAWFSLEMAKSKILRGQVGFLEQLEEKLGW